MIQETATVVKLRVEKYLRQWGQEWLQRDFRNKRHVITMGLHHGSIILQMREEVKASVGAMEEGWEGFYCVVRVEYIVTK